MKVVTRLYLIDDQDEKFFGEGPYRLLKEVEQTGSLHAAAFDLGMAYSKATKLLKNAEKSLGFPLTVRKIGGKAGGGSVLTEEAKDFLQRYEEYRNACLKHNERLFETYFGKNEKKKSRVGCVIMASGLGKRFGGDKLMAELFEKPLLQYAIEATEGLFVSRVVVTRNERVRKWCEERKIPVIFHDLPGRNDTIRLGINALEEICGQEIEGCVFCPADMPFVSRQSLKSMLLAAKDEKYGILRMAHQGTIGAPVLFKTEYFEGLKNLPEGKGGSEIIKANQDRIFYVEAKEETELWDVDTQEDLESVQNEMSMRVKRQK